jgi:hypothetical protein
MTKDGNKSTAQVEKRGSAGEHGGNRGGSHEPQPEQSSQAAGKDPHRGEKK